MWPHFVRKIGATGIGVTTRMWSRRTEKINSKWITHNKNNTETTQESHEERMRTHEEKNRWTKEDSNENPCSRKTTLGGKKSQILLTLDLSLARSTSLYTLWRAMSTKRLLSCTEINHDKTRWFLLVPPGQNENGSSCLLGLGGDGGGGGCTEEPKLLRHQPPPHLTGSAEGLLNSTNKMYQVLCLPVRPCPMSVPQTFTPELFPLHYQAPRSLSCTWFSFAFLCYYF